MKVSEVEHSYNQIPMDKWNPVIEVCFILDESLRRLGLTVEVLEILSIHVLPRAPATHTNSFCPLLDMA